MVLANVVIDDTYNIIVRIEDTEVTTIGVGKYLLVVVGEG